MARTPLSEFMPDFGRDALSQQGPGLIPTEAASPIPRKPTFNFEAEVAEEDVRKDIKTRIEVIVAGLRSAIINTGEGLLELEPIIKKHGRRGAWTRYLENALPFSESSARNYMAAAVAAKSATVAENEQVSPTAMYAIGRAPLEIQCDVQRLLAHGRAVTAAQVKEMTKEEVLAGSACRATAEEGATPDGADATSKSCATGGVPTDDRAKNAANELLARLSKHFDEDQIGELNDLWRLAGFVRIKQSLKDANPAK